MSQPAKQLKDIETTSESNQDSVQDHNNNDSLAKYAINGVLPLNIDSLKINEIAERDKARKQHGLRDENGLWLPGVSPNPAGRPKGTRNKISEDFLRDLNDVWNRETQDGKSTNGLDVIQKVADTEPAKLLAAMVQVLPKDFQVNVTENQTHWVINAQPMTPEQWLAEHNLIEHDDED